MSIRALDEMPRGPFFTKWQRFEFSVLMASMFLLGVYLVSLKEFDCVVWGIFVILISTLIIYGLRVQNLYPYQ